VKRRETNAGVWNNAEQCRSQTIPQRKHTLHNQQLFKKTQYNNNSNMRTSLAMMR
jgi:hypothetical protein